jgi:hypothetical protein
LITTDRTFMGGINLSSASFFTAFLHPLLPLPTYSIQADGGFVFNTAPASATTSASPQGLTLDQLSAQPEPFLTFKTSPKRQDTPSTVAKNIPSTPLKYPLFH